MAKWIKGDYDPRDPTWLKIRNRTYGQTVNRGEAVYAQEVVLITSERPDSLSALAKPPQSSPDTRSIGPAED